MKSIPKGPVVPAGKSSGLSPAAQADLLFAQGKAHHEKGRLPEAERLYRAALRQQPDHVNATHFMGVLLQQRGKHADSIDWLRRAAELRPKDAAIHLNLGTALRNGGEIEKSVEAFEKAAALNPALPEVHYNLGLVQMEAKEYAAAASSFKKYTAARPNDVHGLIDLANALRYCKEFDAAHMALEDALALNAQNVRAYENIGALFRDKGDYFSAIPAFEKAWSLDPRANNARFILSLLLLQTGQLSKGWMHYDARFLNALGGTVVKRPVPPIYWDGEDLSNKTILIWPEQGTGDQTLFAGLFEEVIKQAKKVIIQSKPRMIPIFQRAFPSVTVLPFHSDDPSRNALDGMAADYQIAAGSLGRYFRNDYSSFPKHKGYLTADEKLRGKLRARYEALAQGRHIVGISWKSKNPSIGASKSSDLMSWEAILKTPNVVFVNLQYGDCTEDLSAVRSAHGIEIFNDVEVDPLTDMEAHFAQVAAMDLVISTSNTTVHTSGSINKATWLLLPGEGGTSYWCWFLERSDSPWYPSLRLFRQPTENQSGKRWWDDVVQQVGRELVEWARTKP